jgi:peptidyl-dipeptidase Dcp
MKDSVINNLGKTLVIASVLAVSACNKEEKSVTNTEPAVNPVETVVEPVNMSEKEPEVTINNPLLAEWTGPYGGVPAFDKMKVEDVANAFEIAMAENLADIDAIANNPEPATFENTIAAMEKSGEKLSRGFTYYGILSSNMSTPEFREIQQELAPKFSEMSSKISQNKKLFERVKKVS